MIYAQGIDILSAFLRKRNIIRVGFHAAYINSHLFDLYIYLITTQTKRNLSSRSGIGGVLSAT